MIYRIEDIDLKALREGRVLEQSFDPWRVSEQQIREIIQNEVKRHGVKNKNPFVTFERRNRSNVNNFVRCDPHEKYNKRERVRRDERYSFKTTGKYVYHVPMGEREDLSAVRKRIGSWIKRNCGTEPRSRYDYTTGNMVFYDPEWESKD